MTRFSVGLGSPDQPHPPPPPRPPLPALWDLPGPLDALAGVGIPGPPLAPCTLASWGAELSPPPRGPGSPSQHPLPGPWEPGRAQPSWEAEVIGSINQLN